LFITAFPILRTTTVNNLRDYISYTLHKSPHACLLVPVGSNPSQTVPRDDCGPSGGDSMADLEQSKIAWLFCFVLICFDLFRCESQRNN